MMDNQELLNYCKHRIKTYVFHKMNLKDVFNKDNFEKCKNDLLEDIFDDNKMLLDIESSGQQIAKPVMQEFANLSNFSNSILDFYCKFKILNNF